MKQLQHSITRFITIFFLIIISLLFSSKADAKVSIELRDNGNIFKVTGTGKLMKMKANKSHILNKKSRKRKRRLRQAVEIDATNAKMMKRILPYSK